MRAAIHCNPHIPWHRPFAAKMAEGLYELGIDHLMTSSSRKLHSGEDFSVLLGTTCWRQVECDPAPWLLVDRCSFGDTNQWVSLVWNGHGRRGDHMVPDLFDESRWEQHNIELWPELLGATYTVICGQTETYSPHYANLLQWYDSIEGATHFRPHPAGNNPTRLPVRMEITDSAFHILNSSFGCEMAIKGRPLQVHDEGAMCYHAYEDRERWAQWLAWTQWHHEEIKAGEPIGHLFEWL